MKRIIIFFLFALSVFRLTYAANVNVDGTDFDGARLIDSVTYVPLRSFSETLSEVDVSWDGESRVAGVSDENISLTARIGDSFIKCNDRFLYSGKQNIIIDGSTFVPIRVLAKTFGATVEWDNTTKTAVVTSGVETFKSADEFYNATDLYWLSKIINAESEGESLVGKIAVGNVVLNRVKSNDFPNTVYDVIFDKKGGVQFTPVANGSIYKEASEESIIAAKICLEDYKLSNKNILFFLNPTISTSTWVPDNRDFVMTIGRHDFYA